MKKLNNTFPYQCATFTQAVDGIKQIEIYGKNNEVKVMAYSGDSIISKVKYITLDDRVDVSPVVQNGCYTIQYDNNKIECIQIEVFVPAIVFDKVAVYNENSFIMIYHVCAKRLLCENSNSSIYASMICAASAALKTTFGKIDLSFEKFYLGKNGVLVQVDHGDIYLGLPKDHGLDYNFDLKSDSKKEIYNLLPRKKVDDFHRFHDFGIKLRTKNGRIFID